MLPAIGFELEGLQARQSVNDNLQTDNETIDKIVSPPQSTTTTEKPLDIFAAYLVKTDNENDGDDEEDDDKYNEATACSPAGLIVSNLLFISSPKTNANLNVNLNNNHMPSKQNKTKFKFKSRQTDIGDNDNDGSDDEVSQIKRWSLETIKTPRAIKSTTGNYKPHRRQHQQTSSSTPIKKQNSNSQTIIERYRMTQGKRARQSVDISNRRIRGVTYRPYPSEIVESQATGVIGCDVNSFIARLMSGFCRQS